MDSDRQAFFTTLLARSSTYRHTCLTLTAIHPDGQHPTPSRHIPLDDPVALQAALGRLDEANALGWGAFFAVGLRRPGLTRWQRGGTAEIIALPALFVDVDDFSAEVLTHLQGAQPTPSCLVASGGGYHAYWWLDEPTTDFETARRMLRALAATLHGDPLSLAQSLRVPFTVNTKPARHGAPCQIVELNESRFKLSDFARLLPVRTLDPSTRPRSDRPSPYIPPTNLVTQVADILIHQGCKQRGDWLNGACPFPERHRHGDQHPSFGFNTRTGYGFCHVCGTLLLKDLCVVVGVQPANYRA